MWWDDIHPGATRYLAKDNIKIYDRNGDDKLSFVAHKNLFKLNSAIDIDSFAKIFDKNGLLLLDKELTSSEIKFKDVLIIKNGNDYKLKTKSNNYLLKEVFSKPLKKKKAFLKAYQISEF